MVERPSCGYQVCNEPLSPAWHLVRELKGGMNFRHELSYIALLPDIPQQSSRHLPIVNYNILLKVVRCSFAVRMSRRPL
jgi:hypothetical protein